MNFMVNQSTIREQEIETKITLLTWKSEKLSGYMTNLLNCVEWYTGKFHTFSIIGRNLSHKVIHISLKDVQGTSCIFYSKSVFFFNHACYWSHEIFKMELSTRDKSICSTVLFHYRSYFQKALPPKMWNRIFVSIISVLTTVNSEWTCFFRLLSPKDNYSHSKQTKISTWNNPRQSAIYKWRKISNGILPLAEKVNRITLCLQSSNGGWS